MTIDSAIAPDGLVELDPTSTGPLDGVRVAVKDLYDVAGRVTAAGNPTLAAGGPATAHASAVTKLLAAGARVVCKTATDELAMGMFGVNSHFGTPPNPAAPDRVPGGSSSGSASAVAAGDADLGLGTDTGGSIRVPAAFTGLVGLRPTHGRIDLAGVRPMAERFDTAGLLARTLGLVASAFGVLAGESRAPRTVEELVLLTDLVDRAEPALAGIARSTARTWADALAVPLREASLAAPGLPADLTSVFWPLMSRQLWQANGAWVTQSHPVLGEGIEQRIIDAGKVTDAEVEQAESSRAALLTRLVELLASGVAVMPTTVAPAPLRASTHEQLMDYRGRNLPFVVPASLTGAPQLTLPVGSVSDPVAGTAAPVGVSLLGRPYDDELLLALAERLS